MEKEERRSERNRRRGWDGGRLGVHRLPSPTFGASSMHSSSPWLASKNWRASRRRRFHRSSSTTTGFCPVADAVASSSSPILWQSENISTGKYQTSLCTNLYNVAFSYSEYLWHQEDSLPSLFFYIFKLLDIICKIRAPSNLLFNFNIYFTLKSMFLFFKYIISFDI